ncbi:acyl transferase/acyl hydrolase/lysophospholipase [Ochromonadaceae sp. CCMP2298]|nr:acyl transferase/acyl hydrolase/lysophospholipase [Ochromonadaceae sp. CCMP2298]
MTLCFRWLQQALFLLALLCLCDCLVPTTTVKTIKIRTDPQCMYCTGAGIYFWWQLGVAKYLKENCIKEDLYNTPFIGASAGSVTAAMLLCGADLDILPNAALELGREAGLFNRKSGLAGVWGDLLLKWLQVSIPDDVTADMLKNLEIAVTPTFTKPKLVRGFQNKLELIEAIMASCHVPLFLNGMPYTTYKGERVIDGSFWYFVTKDRVTGLPLPSTPLNGIYWIDYTDDEDFMLTVSGNFLELVSPDGLFEMIDSGYNYMKREHYNGRLPFPKTPMPTFVTLSPIERFPSLKDAANRAAGVAGAYRIKYTDFYKIPDGFSARVSASTERVNSGLQSVWQSASTLAAAAAARAQKVEAKPR